MIRKIGILILLFVFMPAMLYAARLWVNPSDLYLQYQQGSVGVNATVTVTNMDMDGNFTWTASSDVQWISINDGGMVHVDSGNLNLSLNTDVLDTMSPGLYMGSISIMSDIGKFFVNISVNYMASSESQIINIPTAAWLDTVLEVPESALQQSKLYILVEHTTLLPGQVYAYRCSAGGSGAETNCSFDIFSEHGHLMPNAYDLYYDSDMMYNIMTRMVEIPFGGFRLYGLDGQVRVHCMLGTPNAGGRYSMYSIMDLVINVMPLQGLWEVTDNYFGSQYTYQANLYESFGELNGLWDGIAVPEFDYINSSNTMPLAPQLIGSNVYIRNSSIMSGYELKFSQYDSITGSTYDYWYQITDLSSFEDGFVSGIWRMKEENETSWSIPQNFSAVRTDWEYVIPLNMVDLHDSYVTTGYVSSDSVTKYPVAFIVDTGAEMVLMDEADMNYILNPYTADCATSNAIGAGGSQIEVTICSGITIQLTDKIKLENMNVWFTENQTPALLGMDFLKHFNIRFRSSDNAMIISP